MATSLRKSFARVAVMAVPKTAMDENNFLSANKS